MRSAIVLVALLASGCAGIKSYPSNYAPNLQVVTGADSSFFTTMRTAVDIYRVDDACQTAYQGTMQLPGGKSEIGLPDDELMYLVFVFESSSFLASSHSSTTYETLFLAEAKAEYEFEVSYTNKIYGVQMRKTRHDGDEPSIIQARPLASC